MWLNIFILIVGFTLLIKGADYLVEGSSRLARRMGISPLVIGLTIVAFGTSVPELTVNIASSLSGASSLTIGNIVGSNISNIGLIIGLTALLYPLTIKQSTIRKEIPVMLLAVLVLIASVADKTLFDLHVKDILSRNDGIVFLLVFSVFIYYLIGLIYSQKKDAEAVKTEFQENLPKHQINPWKLWTMILGGLAGVAIGGKITVDAAIFLATALGVSQVLLGVTVVAVGTSLPELTTSLVAAYKKRPDIAVGNIVGSNIFNTLPVLGISAIIKPIPFESAWYFDLFMMLAFSFMMLIFSITHNRKINRWEGGVLLAGYLLYITLSIIRG